MELVAKTMEPTDPKPTVLLTGATGYVGRHLGAHLHAQGYRVRAAVRRAANLPAGWSQVAIGEIDSTTDWTTALNGVEYVVHLASYSPDRQASAAEQAAAYYRVNVAGGAALAKAAAAAGVRRFLYLSTIKVNGEATPADCPFTAVSPPQPEDAYGRSKWQVEQLLREMAEDGSLDLLILRPPLVYGADVRGNFLALLRLIARGVPVPVGAVRNRRSMLYVKNLADAVAQALAAPKWAAQTYLLSDGEDLSSPELVGRIAAAMGRPARLWSVPVPLLHAVGLLSGRRAMIDRLTGSLAVDSAPFRQHYCWSPPYSVDAGLRETVTWYLDLRRGAS